MNQKTIPTRQFPASLRSSLLWLRRLQVSPRQRIVLSVLALLALLVPTACGLSLPRVGARNAAPAPSAAESNRAAGAVGQNASSTGQDQQRFQANSGQGATQPGAVQSGAAQAKTAAVPKPAQPATQNGQPSGQPSGQAPAGANGQALPPLPPTGRMIVKSGDMSLQVTDLVDAIQRVGAVVAGIPGAYIAASSTSYRAGPTPTAGPLPPVTAAQPAIIPPRPVPGQSATVSIKVPADSFDDAVRQLRGLGTPMQENVSTQEVTEEFVDLDAQVKNLEATEQDYLKLMDKAQRLEDIIALQQRITDVRTQIDRLRGRMNLLQRRADLSTLTVTLVPPAQRSDTPPATAPRPLQTLQAAWSHLGTLLQALLDVLIYVGVYTLPLVPFAAGYWWWRSTRTNRHAPSTGGAM